MKSIDEYKAEELLKVMLQAAKNKRGLSDVEKKLDLKLEIVSEDRTREIKNKLVRNGWISTHSVSLNHPHNPSKNKYLYFSSEGEGLTPNGEDELERRIEKYNDELNRRIDNNNKERETNRRQFFMKIIGWFFGSIIVGVIIGVLLWFFRLNGNRPAKQPDNKPDLQEQIKTDYDHIQSQITEI